MKKILPCLLGGWLALPAWSADKTDQARLKLPWDTLKNVLRFDQDQVRLSADEFERLVKLTSPTALPDYKITGGDIVLSRADFTRLVQSLQPPAATASSVFIPKGAHRGRLIKNRVDVESSLDIEMPQKPAKPMELDVFPAGVAFDDIRLDGRPALAAVRDGRLFVTVADAGSHRLNVRFSVPVPESNAGQTLRVPLPRTPITEWSLNIPEPRLDIVVSEALHREILPWADGTRVRALLAPTDGVTVSWNPLAPDRAKGPAQIYATVDHLISVEEDALRVKSRVALDVLQNTINEVTFRLPDGFAVLDARGEAVREWQELANPVRLVLPLTSARKGALTFEVTLERVLPGEKSTTTFTGLTVLGALRQRGHVGVELKSDVELPTPRTRDLEPKDAFRELPAELTAQSERLVYGYKYVGPAFGLDLSLARHQSVRLPLAFVDRAEGSTVLRPDGKQVHRATYWVRSIGRQYLALALPDRAALWSAFVDNAPVKPVKGPGHQTLIPLVRSARTGTDVFPVEVVAYEQKPNLSFWGREKIEIPMPDLMVNRIQWSVVAPPNQRLHYWGRDFEDLNRPEPAPEFARADRGFLEQIRFAAKSAAGLRAPAALPAPEEKMDAGADKELGTRSALMGRKKEISDGEDKGLFNTPSDEPGAPPSLIQTRTTGEIAGEGGGAALPAGMLPVRVNVPQSGRPHTYSKTLPAYDGVLTLPLWRWTDGAEAAARIVAGFLALLALFVLRRPLTALGQRGWSRVRGWKCGSFRSWSRRDKMFLSFAAAFLSANVSTFLFVLAMMVHAGTTTRWVLSLLDPSEGEFR